MSTQGKEIDGPSAVDVVVVGFGAAGIAAAITAHDAGAQVLVLEKATREQSGGNTRASGQVWFSPNDPALAKAYLRDGAGAMPIADDVADAWSHEICKTTDWLLARAAEAEGSIEVDPADGWGQGIEHTQISYGDEMKHHLGWDAPEHEFPEFNNEGGTDYLYFGPTQGYSRLWHRIKAALARRGIRVEFGTGAASLTRDVAGRINGVVAEGPEGTRIIEARGGVILACGGFENNPEMIRTFLAKPYATPWGSPENTGDGIKMAQTVGADLCSMYQHLPFFGIRIPGRATGEFVQPAGPGFMNVRKDGRRFIDETLLYRHGKSPIGGALEFYPYTAMWTVFDEDVRLAGRLTTTREQAAIGWLKQVDRYEWSEDNGVEIANGWITRADSIAELAERLGVDPAGLEEEIARYNVFAAKGEDTRFGRAGASMAPIAKAPFYGYEWGNLLINTMGGLRKDGEARVCGVHGDPIPGLYCAGEIAATYTWALSGGMGIADALAFGRIAGRNAAAGVPESVGALQAQQA